MTKPRVLIGHPHVSHKGGGNAVAAWALQALREDFDVTLATLHPVDFEAVNTSFGTDLAPGDFRLRVAPHSYHWLMRLVPTRGALLSICLTMRWTKRVDSGRRFDALLSTQNEADFGRRGLQYVHYPWAYLPRPDDEIRWFHRIPGALAGYRWFCRSMGQGTNEGLRRNLSLANSQFVAGKIRETHGTDSLVLHPPVPGEFPEVEWEKRRTGMAAIGRLGGCKRWEMAVAIVERVRALGAGLSLTLIGHSDDPEYGRRMAALAADRPWFRILQNLTREQLAAEVASHRYGIHTMENEHFGIAPAELQRAGCITFVHNSGGPVEIVGGHPQLTFDTVEDGAAKVFEVMNDEALAGRIREFLAPRRGLFSTTRFSESLRRVVREFLDK
jgi:glycosyltransferase involved in cell wall biosynthesis